MSKAGYAPKTKQTKNLVTFNVLLLYSIVISRFLKMKTADNLEYSFELCRCSMSPFKSFHQGLKDSKGLGQ